MFVHCPRCRRIQKMALIRTWRDRRGRRWEAYRCPGCGGTRQYAVS